ncbi:MAG: hypothetical protein ACJ8AW_19840 [Rhodopila sp.]
MTITRRLLSSRFMSDMALGRKVALIPMLTLLLTGLMLALFVYMGDRNTAALRALDRAVFEPLNRAQKLKDASPGCTRACLRCCPSATTRSIPTSRRPVPRT